MNIRPFIPADSVAVVELWQRCQLTRPWNDPQADIERKLTTQPELFFVVEEAGGIIGSMMAGFDGHRGWVNYLAVDPKHRRRGVGRKLMRLAEESLLARGCPKLNVQVRTMNADVVEFYRKLGYAVDDVVSLGKRLIHDGSGDR